MSGKGRNRAASKGWATRRKRAKWRKENPSTVELMRASLTEEWRAVQRKMAKDLPASPKRANERQGRHAPTLAGTTGHRGAQLGSHFREAEMRAFIAISLDAVALNADGARRPILVVQDERGGVYTAVCITGLNGEFRTQQSHPDPARPDAWVEVFDASLLDLIHDARLEDLKKSFTGQLQEG